MSLTRTRVLVPSASSWVTEVLSSCALGRLIAPTVKGEAWEAIAPPEVTAEALLRFRSGGLFEATPGFTSRDAFDLLVRVVCEHLAVSRTQVGLFYNMASRPSDPHGEDAGIVFYHEEVYGYAKGNDTREAVESSIRAAEYMPYFFGAVGQLPDSSEVCQRSLRLEEMAHFARAASLVFVAAYDFESYLVQERRARN